MFSVSETRLHCIAYGLHLSAKDGIALRDQIVDRLRELIIKLKRSRAMEDFHAELKRKDSQLTQDVVTRWNSTYLMCRSALRIRTELDLYCVTKPEFLEFHFGQEDWETLQQLVGLLEHYQQATLEVSTVDSPTMHVAQDTLFFLKDRLVDAKKSSEVGSL